MPHLLLIVVAEVSIESLHRVRARIKLLLHTEVPMQVFLDLGPHHLETYLVCQPLGEPVIIVLDIIGRQIMRQLRNLQILVFAKRSV